MNINDAFPSKYLKCSDLEGQSVELTIKSIELEEVEETETRPIVYFSDATKGLCLNKTNAAMIADTLGDETTAWVGHKISLFPDKTQFKGKIVDCIRVKVPRPEPAAGEPAKKLKL